MKDLEELKSYYYNKITEAENELININRLVRLYGAKGVDGSKWTIYKKIIRNSYLKINQINQKIGYNGFKTKPREWWKEY